MWEITRTFFNPTNHAKDMKTLTKGLRKTVHHWLDDARGIYIPRDFARDTKRDCITGVSAEDLDYLALGPGGCLDECQELQPGESQRGDFYWDTWQTVLDNATITDPESGNEFKLYQDGSLFLVPVDFEWDDATESFREPESDTLRRYILPAYWASSIFNGDDSGLEDGEQEQIAAFIKREGLEGWTEADCGESYFSHHNDATSLGGDVCEYTFVKIA